MRNWFKKKFRVRISNWYKENYCIEYSYYRLFPIWYELKYWTTPIGGYKYDSSEGWYTIFSKNIDYLEQKAKKFKTIHDIRDHYKHFELMASNFDEKRKEYWNKAIPFKTKNIL